MFNIDCVMKNFNYQLAGDNGIHFYPIGQLNDLNDILISCFKNSPPVGVIDIIPSLVNLLVIFDSNKITSEILIDYVENLDFENIVLEKKKSCHWEIPICYEKKYGLDLGYISEKCNLTERNIINLHQQNIYQVCMMGFLPGLPFLSELDPKLKLPRRSNPRTLVPSGSIGIAINQSVIYPQDSPGGWNIVGRTPVSIFDQRKENSILLSIGDRITFRRITAEEFEEIFNLNQKSHVQIKEIKI